MLVLLLLAVPAGVALLAAALEWLIGIKVLQRYSANANGGIPHAD